MEEGAAAGTDQAQWWERMGFSSWKEAMDELERHQSRLPGRAPLELRNITREVIGLEPIPVPLRETIDRAARPLVRQVNMRLREEDFQALVRAARRHALQPTTLARVLLRRAISAISD